MFNEGFIDHSERQRRSTICFIYIIFLSLSIYIYIHLFAANHVDIEMAAKYYFCVRAAVLTINCKHYIAVRGIAKIQSILSSLGRRLIFLILTILLDMHLN